MKSYGNPDADDVESFINLSQVLTLFTLRKSENNLSDGNSPVFLHFVAKHLKRQSGMAQGFILFSQKSFFSVHMHLIHAKRNVHSIHVRKIWTINLLSLSYSWKPSAGLLLASPQTSFGVRLSRIHFSPTQTNPKGRLRGG